MTEGVRNLINAIASGDAASVSDAFNTEMANRISARLEDMRVQVAQGMFKNPVAEETQIDEEVELTEEALDEMINEVLSKNDPASEWIKDFVDSDDPKFAGKSKEKRKEMALAAYYAKQRNEEIDVADILDHLNEDAEALQELSKKTLQSYQSKIGHDLDRAMDAMPHGTGDDKEDRKLNNRMVGDERAQKRLMKMNK